MSDETPNGKATPSKTTTIPNRYKATVHGLSLLLPPMLWVLCIMRLDHAGPQPPGWFPAFFAAFILLWTTLLYAIAGGFDWKPGAIGIGRAILFALLGGVLMAIPLFMLWVLIRVICSVSFRVPLAAGVGKIWVSGKGTAT